MRNCLRCEKDISSLPKKSKFCSTKCRVAYSRNSTGPIQPVANENSKSGTGSIKESHSKECEGCNGECDFTPLWKQQGLKNKTEGMKLVIDAIFHHKDSIMNAGFSDEVTFFLGKNKIILKGKNAGRKKDMGSGKSKTQE